MQNLWRCPSDRKTSLGVVLEQLLWFITCQVQNSGSQGCKSGGKVGERSSMLQPLGAMMLLYRDNGKETGNYFNMFWVL